ncbi:MAG: ABC transporter ATP-binding protein/permease [Acholeplasmatales bacterium]|nr:ABC transporter ATP-binding protein/permease [Acholeplasmatales bacterium]
MVLGKHFYKYYFKFFIYFLIGVISLIVVDYISLDIPKNIGKIISALEEFSKTGSTSFDFQKSVFTILIIGVIITFGRVLWRLSLLIASRKIEHDIRIKMFNKALLLSRDFYSKEKIGNLMSFFTNDLNAIRNNYGWGLLMLVDSVTLTIFSVTRMIDISLKMTLFLSIPVMGLFIVFFIFNKRIRSRFLLRQEAFSKLSDFTQEAYSGISVLKAFVREEKFSERFSEKSIDLKEKHITFVKQSIFVNISINVVASIAILIILWYTSFLVIGGKSNFTSGQFTEYTSYYFTLIWPAMAISQFLNFSNQSRASEKRISSLLDEKILVRNKVNCEIDPIIDGSITASHLSFIYPDSETKVLDDISFKINKGEMVGILGRTGSGKSSLVDLLLRIYNVENNMLFLGNNDIMDLRVEDVRKNIGYVPQDNFLFSDTIKSNIAFSDEVPSLDLVINSSKLSDVYENIIEFEQGFDTILGERGVTVSGGQKQRISIARAIYKNPEILILDDSVSAVDTLTEEEIIANLHEIRSNKTTIFIAHRISTVKKMNKIILLDLGKIVDIGTHDELNKRCPLYQELVRLQTLEEKAIGK